MESVFWNFLLISNEKLIHYYFSDIIGQSCFNHSDCQLLTNVHCSVENKCTCNQGYVQFNSTTCKSLLNAFCWESDECMPINSFCIDNRCKCRSGYIGQYRERCISGNDWEIVYCIVRLLR